MNGAIALDVIVIILIIGACFAGWRSGLLRSAFRAAGLIAGGIAAYLLLPLISSWVPASEWRLPVVLLCGLSLLAIGTTL
ncbi:CvpA family protein, partial [Rhizobium johnstonii]|uniref:CvpA family protein n=1 Tax=Rhizobium johnstonii TaxID=3019933 RepID=UPI003F95682F